MVRVTPLEDVLELADLLRPAWDEISDGIPAWHPRNEGEAAEGEGNGEEESAGAGDAEEGSGGGGEDEGSGEGGREPDWKSESRKHERRAKSTAKDLEKARAELEELRKGQQTESEKALEDAKREAREAALAEAEQERRNDRLEVAVARAAAKTFADVDDALLHIQRAITAGEVDQDDIFSDEGKVQTDALKTALDELLERKPHLKADPSNGRPSGSADAGRGKSAGALEDMSIEEHARRQGRIK